MDNSIKGIILLSVIAGVLFYCMKKMDMHPFVYLMYKVYASVAVISALIVAFLYVTEVCRG